MEDKESPKNPEHKGWPEWLKKLVEKKGGEPWPGTQDSGQHQKTGEVPPEREDLTSGKSGGVSEPDQDLGV